MKQPEPPKNESRLLDRIQLGPIELYRKHNYFPWRLVLHIVLVIITSAQVLTLCENTFSHARADLRYIYYWFISNKTEAYQTSGDYPRFIGIFDIDKLNDTLRSSIDHFYGAEEESVAQFQYVTNKSSGARTDVEVEYSYWEHAWDSELLLKDVINETYAAILDYEDAEFKEMLRQLRAITLTYRIKSYSAAHRGNPYVSCNSWTIKQNVVFEHLSNARITLDVSQQLCEGYTTYHWTRKLWIHMAVLVVSFFAMIYSWKRFFDAIYWYRKIRETVLKPLLDYLNIDTLDKSIEIMHEKNERHKLDMQMDKLGVYSDGPGKSGSAAEKELDKRARTKRELREKTPSLLGTWQYLSLIANIFQVLGSGLYLIDVRQRSSANVIIGFGCFFGWLNILRYLQYNSQYSALFTSLMKSLPTVAKFMVGILPLFLGYAFFATAVFWQSARFSSMSRAMYTQFALLNGDGIFDAFADLSYLNFGLGQVYLYSFIILFICVVQNLFLSIVQKVYAENRKAESEKPPVQSKQQVKEGNAVPKLEDRKTPMLSRLEKLDGLVYKNREEGTTDSRKEVEFAYKKMLEGLKKKIEAELKKAEAVEEQKQP